MISNSGTTDNYRGNMYSRKHKYLDPDRDLKFWDYSLHELGTQDLTASIDYILGVTGASRLVYVGISMGTTMFWVLGAARPQYMNKIEAMVALAPVARTTHATFLNSPARCNNARVVVTALERLGYREVLRYNETAASMLYNGCTSSWVWRPICLLFINTFEYFTRNNWDNVRLLESLKYSPAGIATKVLHHYIQIAKARTFQQFDYGLEENRRRYHTSGLPPEYDLSNVNCSKIYFVTSDSDLIANKQVAGQTDVDLGPTHSALQSPGDRHRQASNGLSHHTSSELPQTELPDVDNHCIEIMRLKATATCRLVVVPETILEDGDTNV
ncbi:lipase 1-like isoform X3 [Macrosteles quadrilineatus]|uniref:lipase 1-like isoform X3 n=1 Tax=Macrosteles quadrilineatus TaxID=74068 RepID=UPI0023E227CC|nr:lipase 1-like isoform X3 [Macrosteles quadrilineatus]